MPPTSYDPNSVEEQPVALPSAPLSRLSDNVSLQPPLTRRGSGPGVIAFLPPVSAVQVSESAVKSLDPEPQQKWAEEGFAVVARTGNDGWSVEETIKKGLEALKDLDAVDNKDQFGVLGLSPQTVYDEGIAEEVVSHISGYPLVMALIVHGALVPTPTIPSLLHLPSSADPPPSFPQLKVHKYPSSSSHFILPQSVDYDHGSANLAHSRSLTFLRSALGGPYFDLEAIWDEHTYFEFEVRSVAKTMGTMVQEPYVNHVPTMTGGMGREKLSAFYRDHFIFCNPPDTKLIPVSRTIGADRVVDEFVVSLTHTQTIDWFLPNVPPTGRKLSVPFVAVVNIRGDRLYHEHIWWDHASALKQAGLLPDRVGGGPALNSKGIRLPVAGEEGAKLLLNEMDGKSNEMIVPKWAVPQLE